MSSAVVPRLTALAERLPAAWLPFSYLRRLPLDAKRHAWIHLQGLPTETELLVEDHPNGVALGRYLSWDSAFFHRPIFRLDAVTGSSEKSIGSVLRQWEDSARTKSASYLFGIIPVEETTTLAALGKLGWATIETRVTYSRRLEKLPLHRFSVRPAQLSELEALQETAAAAVNPYDRFRADPFFSALDCERLFKEWIRASVKKTLADEVLVPASDGGKAFMTLNYLKTLWPILIHRVSQIPLSAIHPQAKGWHPRLLVESLWHLQSIGAESVFMTTQAANREVIRTLEHTGFQFSSSQVVIRKVL